MGVKCFAQEHNVVPRPGLEPEPFGPQSSALTIRPRASHLMNIGTPRSHLMNIGKKLQVS